MRTIKPVEIFRGFARNQDELGARLCVQVALEKCNQPVVKTAVNQARPGQDRIAPQIHLRTHLANELRKDNVNRNRVRVEAIRTRGEN